MTPSSRPPEPDDCMADTGVCRHLEVPSDAAQLARVRAFVRAVCASAGIDRSDREKADGLELAVNEAVANVIEHAYRDMPAGRIRISARVTKTALSVTIADDGVRFDPASAPPPAFDGSAEGGFGLFIITQCVDDVAYERDAGGTNRTILTIRPKGER